MPNTWAEVGLRTRSTDRLEAAQASVLQVLKPTSQALRLEAAQAGQRWA